MSEQSQESDPQLMDSAGALMLASLQTCNNKLLSIISDLVYDFFKQTKTTLLYYLQLTLKKCYLNVKTCIEICFTLNIAKYWKLPNLHRDALSIHIP